MSTELRRTTPAERKALTEEGFKLTSLPDEVPEVWCRPGGATIYLSIVIHGVGPCSDQADFLEILGER